MGLTNLTFGFYGGMVAFAIPQLLSARGVPEHSIAGLTAISFSPLFWAFLLSPVLDVRFSRRWYGAVLALVAAGTLLFAFLNLGRLPYLTAALTLGLLATYLNQSAIAGWYSAITSPEQEKTLSVWMTVANIGGFGVIAVCCNQLERRLSPLLVGVVLAVMLLVPLLVYPFIHAPGPDRRLAGESFPQFFRDLLLLVRRRKVLLALLLFLLPAATFSLTNFLGARGGDFGASPGFVGLVGGAGVTVGGVAGCFLFRPLSRRVPLLWLYLAIGLLGSLGTLLFILLPHTPASYAVVLIGENLFQGFAVTAATAITFDVIGRDNPLASTTYCFVISAYGLPLTYMLYVDSFGFSRHGIAGSFAIDALAGIVATVLLAGVLLRAGRTPSTA